VLLSAFALTNAILILSSEKLRHDELLRHLVHMFGLAFVGNLTACFMFLSTAAETNLTVRCFPGIIPANIITVLSALLMLYGLMSFALRCSTEHSYRLHVVLMFCLLILFGGGMIARQFSDLFHVLHGMAQLDTGIMNLWNLGCLGVAVLSAPCYWLYKKITGEHWIDAKRRTVQNILLAFFALNILLRFVLFHRGQSGYQRHLGL
jgi:hypothetical protein